MALAKGTNSYATVAEANTYFETRLDVVAWSSASDAQKAQALVTATSILDELSWSGYAVSESQSLAFPRAGEYFDPRYGFNKTMDPVPERVVKATFELAYHLLNNDGLLDSTGSVERISVAGITLDNIIPTSTIPSTVDRLVKPLLQNAGAMMWWRAN